MAVLVQNTNGHLQSRLTRTLERILEEANQSGELRLSNRKLKDFPKFGEQHVLTDTVIADLSKNRFSELPEEITSFFYLEKLVCYHNAIRYLPDGLTNLRCLSFLDLSRNQLAALPREVCQLPIQILLLSNNRLKSLPDELSKMSQLTELDASCNQLAYLPPRMYELRKLQSLILRNNMLLVLPVDITTLSLVRLDLRANRISVLPIELKDMDSVVDLLLEDNPFTSPPASLCKKGRVHIFKYLETEAMNMQVKCSGMTTGGTLGRKTKKNGGSPGPTHFDRLKQKRYNVDSGYSSDDKRWSQEMSGDLDKAWSNPTLLSHIEDGVMQPTISAPSINSTQGNCDDSEKKDEIKNINGNSSRLSPVADFNNFGHTNGYDEKWKAPQQIQTYREYKEALKQQRAQEVSSIYRTKDSDDYSYKTAPNTPTHHTSPQSSLATSKSDPTPLNSILGSPKKIFDDTTNKKPTQKVKPSVNNVHTISSYINGNGTIVENTENPHTNNQQFIQDYVKPTSPLKCSMVSKISLDNKSHSAKQHPNSGINNASNGGTTLKIMYDASNGTSRSFPGKTEVPPDKMTFTMRREIDKAREETDLINQLRNIIETRLKMMLPNDLASSLTDGVVLCHLANHIKPRSVASIHVPSPAVPKLTMARCRRNVDNFIEACRKIGVDETLLCCAGDVLQGKGLVQIAITVTELIRFQALKSPTHSISTMI